MMICLAAVISTGSPSSADSSRNRSASASNSVVVGPCVRSPRCRFLVDGEHDDRRYPAAQQPECQLS